MSEDLRSNKNIYLDNYISFKSDARYESKTWYTIVFAFVMS